jgi:MoaA/NifB/PqqE/SkfB family radical SAM enzyme|tara:strand:- start:53 stop:709 length:657 start_codon:yes stop_codon:yes gene_type:complete
MITYDTFCGRQRNKSTFGTKRDSVNLDTTHRCSLLCPNCARQTSFTDFGKKVPGVDISMDSFNKLIKYFYHINFEGQYSDPVHHPKFLEMLKICYDKKVSVSVQHASAAKPEKWYIEAFKTNPRALWRFSIDGLPKDSHKYRINQDGEKLFRVMKEAKKILYKKPMWQYIVFNYNENDIETCKQMAKDINVDFYVMKSGRWNGKKDPLMPSKKWRAGN